MADNYLERRMEDLRSGRLGGNATRKSAPESRKGWIRFRFPSRRVLIVDLGDDRCVEALSRGFIDSDCKVAVLEAESSDFSRLSGGARCFPAGSDPGRVVAELFNAWRDLEVVVFVGDTVGCEIPGKILEQWIQMRRNLPLANDYGGRVIAVREVSDDRCGSGLAGSVIGDELKVGLSELKITISEISLRDDDSLRPLVGTVLFLCAPENGALGGNRLRL